MLMHFFILVTCMWEDVHFCVKLTDEFIHCFGSWAVTNIFFDKTRGVVVINLAHIPRVLDSIPSGEIFHNYTALNQR